LGRRLGRSKAAIKKWINSTRAKLDFHRELFKKAANIFKAFEWM
jgi:hypothetical protein